MEWFWRFYSHVKYIPRIRQVTSVSSKKELSLCQRELANKNGGKYITWLCEGLAACYWEEVILVVLVNSSWPGRSVDL